jgi:trk system potassium uptake protein TrkH
MRKLSPFFSFLLIFLGLIFLNFSLNQLIFSDVLGSLPRFSTAIAPAALTQINGPFINQDLPLSYLVLLLIITQLSGIVFLSYLLWFYRKLFGSTEDDRFGLRDAFKLTIIISLISETLLFLFFVYSIPAELADFSLLKRIIFALSLAINSFNNAGVSHLFTPEILEQNYILQIGLIGGSTLGSLGIFVMYELFSPIKLRERLNDTSIDWSFITKVSVFGTASILIIASIAFYFLELNNFLGDKNLMEAVIASFYEISSARGFGFYLADQVELKFTTVLKILVSFFGSGPFSTGGGISLLGLVWLFSLIWKRNTKSAHIVISKSIVIYFLYYTLITFGIFTFLLILFDSESTIYALLIGQLELFTSNHITLPSSSNGPVDLIRGATLFAGRIGFIAACFLTLKQQKT